MKFDVVMIYYLDLQCTLGEMFANTCACIDDFIKKKQHSACTCIIYWCVHILHLESLLQFGQLCEFLQCQKFVFYFTENLKEEPKHKDPVTKTQSFRQNRMKVSAPIPSVEDIATIKHKKKVCLQRTSAKN